MSGIYIKGMEIPSSCSLCFFAVHDMCVVTGKDAEDWWETRPEYCPLVPAKDLAEIISAPCPPNQNCGRNMCYPLPECVECWRRWLEAEA